MSIIHILQSKKKGMTTILGTLLFVSIIFTALVPLQLSMLQTDTYESRLIEELENTAEEKEQENLYLLAYPSENTSGFMVYVENRGTLDIGVANVWIKDMRFSLDSTVSSSDFTTLGPLDFTPDPDTSYPVKITTDRGNTFHSSSGNLIYQSDGTWFTPSLGINVHIANDKGKYWIQVSNSTWTSTPYETLGEDFGDLIVLFDVKTAGVYTVECKKNSQSGPDLPGTPTEAEVKWPYGTPVVFVYTSGLDT